MEKNIFKFKIMCLRLNKKITKNVQVKSDFDCTEFCQMTIKWNVYSDATKQRLFLAKLPCSHECNKPLHIFSVVNDS